MNDINIERIKKLSGEIKTALKQLRSIHEVGREEFFGDPDKIGSAKYNLILAIQSTIDICNHIVAKKGARAPEDYADCFRVLSEMGIIEAGFADRYIRMARFRNLLIHIYWEVDNEKVFGFLGSNLNDFENFLTEVGKFLKKEIG